MLTYGIAIDQPKDPLQKTAVETIVRKIKRPKPEFASRIEQLRQVRLIDEKQYRRQKVSLPYFCCGVFNPPFRRKENFVAIRYFTLDFDHFSAENISKESVFQKLQEDHYIRLLFTTPGGDGLKALFQLDEACTDPGKYTHFYKAFAGSFAKKYKLEKVTDWVTHDVTRATFFSADPQAWDNPIAVPVKMQDFINDFMDNSYSSVEKEFAALAGENASAEQLPKAGNPDNTAMTFIKSRLNPQYRPKKEKNIFIPEEIKEAIPLIQEALEKERINIVSMKSIHFGKQLKVQMDQYWAEVNVFYGQKGFTIVRTTKTGSHAELGELAYQVLDNLLN